MLFRTTLKTPLTRLPASAALLTQPPERPFSVKQRPPPEPKSDSDASVSSPFAHDSTFSLIKKMFIYKMMASNLFINYSLPAMQYLYRFIGVPVTNSLIETTAGSIFTGGVSVQDLVAETERLEQLNVGVISMMVVEGLSNAEEATLDYFYEMSKDTVRVMTEGRSEAHFAVKLTAFVSLEVMQRMSTAQDAFLTKILELDYCDLDE